MAAQADRLVAGRLMAGRTGSETPEERPSGDSPRQTPKRKPKKALLGASSFRSLENNVGSFKTGDWTPGVLKGGTMSMVSAEWDRFTGKTAAQDYKKKEKRIEQRYAPQLADISQKRETRIQGYETEAGTAANLANKYRAGMDQSLAESQGYIKELGGVREKVKNVPTMAQGRSGQYFSGMEEQISTEAAGAREGMMRNMAAQGIDANSPAAVNAMANLERSKAQSMRSGRVQALKSATEQVNQEIATEVDVLGKQLAGSQSIAGEQGRQVGVYEQIRSNLLDRIENARSQEEKMVLAQKLMDIESLMAEDERNAARRKGTAATMGTLVGAGIGLAATGGNPMGAAAGASIGGGLGSAMGG